MLVGRVLEETIGTDALRMGGGEVCLGLGLEGLVVRWDS